MIPISKKISVDNSAAPLSDSYGICIMYLYILNCVLNNFLHVNQSDFKFRVNVIHLYGLNHVCVCVTN